MMLRFKIGAADAAKYGHPEWVDLDTAKLDDQPFSVLSDWEADMGVTLAEIALGFSRGSALGRKGWLWVARKLNGIDTPPFAEFDVRTRQIRVDNRGGGAVPPPGGSSEPSPPTE